MSRISFVFASVALLAVFCSPSGAQAQVAYVHGGFYAGPAVGATVYSPPFYPAYGAVVHSPPLYAAPGAVMYAPPLYAGYAAPAPVAYGGYVTAYPPVAPIGHALIHPREGMEIEYKYRRGLWWVEVDD